MRVLLTGASGFIGRHLAKALRERGHAVVRTGRRHHARPDAGRSEAGWDDAGREHAGDAFVEADFTRDTTAEAWLPRLENVDAVVNAAGILRERGSQTFESLHARAPCALFDACVAAGVGRVINISALGADENAASRYHLSKQRADRHLSQLPLAWTIVQPSLVYGPGGTSARLFTGLASLPLVPLPAGGRQPVQPIHIDDVVDGILALLERADATRCVIPFVGSQAMSFRSLLERLRAGMQLGRARFVSIPMPFMRLAARIGGVLPGALLDTETLQMLMRGNVASAKAITELLGRKPRPVERFISLSSAEATRTSALLSWLLPMLRVSIALVWIVTGIVSLGLYPVEASYELLARTGVPAGLQPLFLYGAAALDLALGFATLLMRRRRALWIAQATLILVYTVIITVRLPEFWLHPYGPLLKNVPMLAAIALLYLTEKR